MNFNALNQELKNILEKIISGYQPQKVILFGSAVRGEMRKDSDIDLLIVKDDPDKRPFRGAKVYGILRDIKRNFPLDVIVYTPAELEYRRSLGDYFIEDVLTEGKVLYEK
ncbi:nucleotidyltransferase domain-containing protein [Candidatus Gottesmanbacteria bacterium]|nr:nucleotidyltransferase domain-containing protein [Candidatus Gottesmanbacteria bacterium]